MKIVIKIGSNVLMGNKDCLDLELMKNIVNEISEIKKQGHDVLIVTSGAVATGKTAVTGATSTMAVVGQATLMHNYKKMFDKYNIQIAQLLLVSDDFKNREKYKHLKQTLNELFDNNIIPIINENDATSVGESFGDNDSLASMVAVITEADKLIFLTNLNGLYSLDPNINKTAKIVKAVNNVSLQIQKMCSKETSSSGTGGMLSKLKGAKLATTCGIQTYIINGLVNGNLAKLLINNKKIGTEFKVQHEKLSESKKWLLISTAFNGKISNKRIGIIGAGVMGSILATRLSKSQVFINDNDRSKLIGVKNYATIVYNQKELVENSDILILAVRPQDFKKLAKSLKGFISKDKLIISIMAGVKIETIQRLLDVNQVARAMPNMPSKIGRGVTVWKGNFDAGEIFGYLGKEIEVEDEQYIDMATAVSGSGPAYVYLFQELFIDAAKSIGLPNNIAEELVLETISGAVALQGSRDKVASKGGTTIEAIKVFEENNLALIFKQAVRKAYERSQQLND